MSYEEMRAKVRIWVLSIAILFTGIAAGLWVSHQPWVSNHPQFVEVEAVREVVREVPVEHDHPCFYGVVTITEPFEGGGARSVIGDGKVCGEWGVTTGPSKLYPYRYDYPQGGENR